ncbi:hypothetical protein O3P69_013924 [Scylla paramamosain]|uniref:Uncharacterized protein n=1 Tax=Scylla paramamosain TaxID=85552 RepID=A0AAW0SSA0_SCYPA
MEVILKIGSPLSFYQCADGVVVKEVEEKMAGGDERRGVEERMPRRVWFKIDFLNPNIEIKDPGESTSKTFLSTSSPTRCEPSQHILRQKTDKQPFERIPKRGEARRGEEGREPDGMQQAEVDYTADLLDHLLGRAQKRSPDIYLFRRSCIRRGGACDHRPNDCCYNSSCRCNLWGTNCSVAPGTLPHLDCLLVANFPFPPFSSTSRCSPALRSLMVEPFSYRVLFPIASSPLIRLPTTALRNLILPPREIPGRTRPASP